MKNLIRKLVFASIIGFMISTCANRGTISGGEKDKEPPVITRESPENFSTNFNENEIRIYFNEYVKVKDLQKQLIISPPMKTQPAITPLGSASKFIEIKIFDTLQPNTTYAFNFGESIVDNNENNPYSFYRYVFSTGDYIDSLSVEGTIIDAEKKKPEEFVSVMLYQVDSTFTDSIIYKKPPKYITNTLDSTTTFKLENLKAGKYLMIALKDGNNSNKYEQKADRIAFKKEFIDVPTQNTFELKLFTEEPDPKIIRPKQSAGNKIAFGYEGNEKDFKIELLSETPTEFTSRITKDPNADTLNFWYMPKIELDSLLFRVTSLKAKDSIYIKVRDMLKDSLVIKPIQSGILRLNEDFEIEGSIPFKAINNELITLIDKDSLNMSYTTNLDSLKNRLIFDFNKEEDGLYNIKMLPGAITDLFENTNDTLTYSLRTKNASDYGKARINLVNAVFPVIVQLADANGNVAAELYGEKNQPFDFDNLDAGKYFIRVIYDSNKNGKWDTGNYLKKIQPERISYSPAMIEVRANWDIIETFTLN
ncbi:MAG: Ig-like domain-containing protein [Flavobacteriaceae bacterium]|nr:Ig-like domain-containing protein [Bacteroidia bacterium]NNL60027.1 Ig-like domain-containing protein [Flavobacteriaceae bacterium]